MTFELRDYQREAVDGLYNYWGWQGGGKPTDCRANWVWQDGDYRADRKGCNGFYWHTGFDL
jgi:hypothetical protein